MAQITWQNINAPDFSSSMLGTGAAGDRLSKVFNPLEQALKDKVAMDDENYDNTTKNINMAIRDRIGQVGGLGELNQLGEQGLLDQARQQFGTRISEEDLRAGFANQQGILQDRAVDESLPGAYAAGDKTLRSSDSGSALYQSLLDLNVKPSDAMSRTSDFMKNNTFKERLYKEAKDAELEERVSNTPTPTSNEQVNEFVAQAVKDGFRGDPDALRSRYMQEAGGFLADESNRNAQEDRAYNKKEQQRLEKERIAVDNAYDQMTKDIEAGLNLTEIIKNTQRLVGGKKGAEIAAATRVEYEQRSQLNSFQEKEYESLVKTTATEIANHSARLDTEVGLAQKAYADKLGLTPADLERSQKMIGAGDIVKGLAGKAGEGSIWQTSFWGNADGEAALAAINEPLQKLIDGEKDKNGEWINKPVPRPDAILIMTQAVEATAGSDKGWVGKTINKSVLNKNINKGKANWRGAEAYKSRWIDLQTKAEEDKRDLETKQDLHLSSWLEVTRKNNLMSGKSATPEDVAQSLASVKENRFTIDKEFGMLGALEREKKEAEDFAIENLIRKRQEQIDKDQGSLRDPDTENKGKKALQQAVEKYDTEKVIGQIGPNSLSLITTQDGYKINDQGTWREPSEQEMLEISKKAFLGQLSRTGKPLDTTKYKKRMADSKLNEKQMWEAYKPK